MFFPIYSKSIRGLVFCLANKSSANCVRAPSCHVLSFFQNLFTQIDFIAIIFTFAAHYTEFKMSFS